MMGIMFHKKWIFSKKNSPKSIGSETIKLEHCRIIYAGVTVPPKVKRMTIVMKRTKPVLKLQIAAALPAILASTLSIGVALAVVCPAVAQDSVAPTNIVALPVASELFAGQDKTGPYVLTWKKLPALAISRDYKPKVIVDDKELGDGGYSWDSENGTITFTAVVKAASMVHIEYPYDPNSSERNPNPNMAPGHPACIESRRS